MEEIIIAGVVMMVSAIVLMVMEVITLVYYFTGVMEEVMESWNIGHRV